MGLFPGLDMVAAIYSGVLASTATPSNISCPSGTCTWPLTPSIAVCGGCVNTTYTQKCYNSTGLGFCDYALPSGSVATLAEPSMI
ncbi:hypothetical protein EJ03DRAFT_382020, partial [Teratosphaeria nubilosa]